MVPYEFTIALAENAADNGVEFRIRREVTAIDSTAEGFEVTARQWETPEYAATAGGAGSLPALPVLGALLVAPGAAAAAAAQAGFATETMLGGAAAALGEFGACAVAGMVLACGYSVVAALLAGGKGPAPVGHGGAPVTVAEMATGGSGTSSVLSGVTAATEKIRCSYVVNCAGSASDTVARMVGDDSFKIKPRCALFHRHNRILGAHLTVLRLGEYLLLHKNQGPKASATLFPAPGPMGKGVLVQGTLWGNLILGPTARDVHNPEHINQTSEEITGYILRKCKELVPEFDASQVIHAFAGARAKSDRNDWSAPIPFIYRTTHQNLTPPDVSADRQDH